MNISVQVSAAHLQTSRPTLTAKRPVSLKASSIIAYTKALRHFREVFDGKLPCDRTTIERYITAQRNKVAPEIGRAHV